MENLFTGLMVFGLIGFIWFLFIYLNVVAIYDIKTTAPVVIFIILSTIYVVGLIGHMVLENKPKPLNKQYEEKIQAIDTAEKELQKFLIKHPEFKE